MGLIKAQGDREQAMSEAEWKQLSNLIENDRRERVSHPLHPCYLHIDHLIIIIRHITSRGELNQIHSGSISSLQADVSDTANTPNQFDTH